MRGPTAVIYVACNYEDLFLKDAVGRAVSPTSVYMLVCRLSAFLSQNDKVHICGKCMTFV